MESSLHKREEERRDQADIRKQITVLQAQLKDLPEDQPSPCRSPKRKKKEPVLLAPATPSPRKRRKTKHLEQSRSTSSIRPHHSRATLEPLNQEPEHDAPAFQKPKPSNFLSKLADFRSQEEEEEATNTGRSSRTTAFTDKTRPHPIPSSSSSIQRDDRLALVANMEPGPIKHTPSFDDPLFEKIEPNSGIRLSSRALSHEDLQDHLRGRYYLSPSLLYSCIRLLPDKQGYDVPVPGDWVTIAVVAERGPLKYTSAPVEVRKDDDEAAKQKRKPSDGKETSKGKKYINFKLIDFGSRSSGSASGGKSVIRGDAFLTLLLFEADSYDLVSHEGSKRPEKIYKGGSRGAFEAMTKLKEGDVVALLNPRVLKPFQRRHDDPHPVHNILAITPESTTSITTIGRSKDLGMCTAVKRDGKVCGSWCDKRVGNVCDYHLQTAIDSRRASRPEFSGGTSGLSKAKRKSDYDPRRQWGLQPTNQSSDSDATYVFSGHIAGGDPFFADTFGRDGQTRAQKKMANRESEKVLQKLLERDKVGMQGIMKTRQMMKDTKNLGEGGGEKGLEGQEGASAILDGNHPQSKRRSRATFQLVKMTGFDPTTTRHGEARPRSEDVQKKMDELAALHRSRKNMVPGPRTAKRSRSAVIPPPARDSLREPQSVTTGIGEGLIDLDSD
ncbi:hypothetical protein E1B28_007517 [Marasmius oreades]|uniref:Zinc finger Mcm10/DnaG-type domain-containing protein n=1 Tax=Marasmius oreades TaxID=181124 RepID=A0A9P7S2C2_9AGAR|nr:uncharacterized protein E1B28_007517 [Marasmius oreades]KAG7093878.1 hypothetical protein E1B28_007517 [Marasmius oreades]